MYRATVNKFRFDYEEETNRILVYEEGSGVDPIAYITDTVISSEKDFHYEIMSWLSNTQNTY